MTTKKINKEIQFSQARQQLSAIIDEVQKPGRAVTILRHGKPAAVVISHEDFEFQQRLLGKKHEWKLAGSMIPVPGVDMEEAIREMREERRKAWEANMERLAKECED